VRDSALVTAGRNRFTARKVHTLYPLVLLVKALGLSFVYGGTLLGYS
jgi:hypothetical protein